MTALSIVVRGRVQGVGFRAWTVRTARALGLSGWVRNRADGSVEILAAGSAEALARLVDACHRGPPAAEVRDVAQAAAAPPATGGFVEAPNA